MEGDVLLGRADADGFLTLFEPVRWRRGVTVHAVHHEPSAVVEPGAEGGSGSARRGLGGWLKAGAKAVVLLGGCLFWGT